MSNVATDGQLQGAVTDAVTRIIKKRADDLRLNILYEISVANTELAFDGAGDRYDLRALSEAYADSISVKPVELNGGAVTTQLVIETSRMKNLSEKEFEFFKKYVLENALHSPHK